MNEFLIFCLIFFVFVRLVGLIVAIDFFYNTKEHKFKMLIFGWSCWIVAGIIAIFVNTLNETGLNEVLLVFNVLFGMIGSIFNAWGLLEYYISVPHKFMKIFLLLTTLMTLFLYLTVNLLASMIFGIIILNIALFGSFILSPLKKKKFKEFMGKSITWYYLTVFTFFIYFPISIFISTKGYGYGVYNTTDPIIIMLNYLPTLVGTILLVVLFVHLEYSTSTRQKNELKDKYSHNLGNIMQIIVSATDISEMHYKQGRDILPNLQIIKEKTKEAAKLIKEIRKL